MLQWFSTSFWAETATQSALHVSCVWLLLFCEERESSRRASQLQAVPVELGAPWQWVGWIGGEITKTDEEMVGLRKPPKCRPRVTETTILQDFCIVLGSDVGFRRVRNVLKTPLFTWFCAATCILYWCPQYFVNVAFFTAICSVFRRCSKKNAKPSHASAHFAKCVLQKNEMDCLGTYFPHAQT